MEERVAVDAAMDDAVIGVRAVADDAADGIGSRKSVAVGAVFDDAVFEGSAVRAGPAVPEGEAPERCSSCN